MHSKLFAAFWLFVCSIAGAQTVGSAPTAVTVLQSRQFVFNSKALGREMLIKVRFPESYDSSEKTYPVLYLLDGDFFFAAATDIVQYLEWGKLMPEVIIVSPAYGNKKYPAQGGSNLRQFDFAVTPHGVVKEAHPERFYSFLKEELIPFADKNFRTDSTDRCLWGYSSGSAFGSYVLFHKKQPFQRYILLEGFLAQAVTDEKEFSKVHTDFPLRLFFGYGIQSPESKELLNSLKQRNYPNLSLHTVQLSNTEHFAIAGEGLTTGLKAVYKN
ncbi:MAG TPA: alpha/beta hydrolase-fold protein [Chitinophagaceae bacterium]|jgi:predicted alpha/beta superfamily hydrolase|nr:alpha/beta hydrolase-fold protein [Chitinophagaceae bacterium]